MIQQSIILTKQKNFPKKKNIKKVLHMLYSKKKKFLLVTVNWIKLFQLTKKQLPLENK